MMKITSNVVWLNDKTNDTEIVGTKALNLFEMMKLNSQSRNRRPLGR